MFTKPTNLNTTHVAYATVSTLLAYWLLSGSAQRTAESMLTWSVPGLF